MASSMEEALQKVSQLKAKASNALIVRFKDNQYSADQLGHQSSSGPLIEISSDELHDNFISMVSTTPGLPPEMMNRTPVFAKYEGKYVVLLGLGSIMASYRSVKEGQSIKLKGRLLSNPMLKRCIA